MQMDEWLHGQMDRQVYGQMGRFLKFCCFFFCYFYFCLLWDFGSQVHGTELIILLGSWQIFIVNQCIFSLLFYFMIFLIHFCSINPLQIPPGSYSHAVNGHSSNPHSMGFVVICNASIHEIYFLLMQICSYCHNWHHMLFLTILFKFIVMKSAYFIVMKSFPC